MSSLHSTSRVSISWWTRAGAIVAVAVAVAGVADRFVAPAGAQTAPVTEVVSQNTDGSPLSPENTAPAISDDAAVVAFVTLDDAGVPIVAIRDRSAGTTLRVAEPGSSNPAVSGDGCVVAYLVEKPGPIDGDDPDASPTSVELHAVDRCRRPGALVAVPVDQADVSGGLATPALSQDGRLIAWSTGTGIVRFDGLANTAGVVNLYVQDQGFDPLADGAAIIPAGAVTGAGVDVSADGSVVAFVAGPAGEPYGPLPPEIYVWSAGTVELASIPSSAVPTAPPEAGSTGPVLSGDGTLVLFESSDTDLAAAAPNPATVVPFVVMYQRGVQSAVLDEGARRPAISVDGHHAVYDRGGVIQSIRWSEGEPFASVTREVVVGTPDDDPATNSESVSGPVVSENGRSVVFDSADGAALTDDARFHTGTQVWLRLRPEEAGGPEVDLGAIEVPGSATGTATFTNTGSVGIPVDSVAVDTPFQVVATTCAGVLQPGVACTVDVSVAADVEGALAGVVRLRGGTPSTEFTIDVVAIGVAPSTTTSTTTTSTSSTTTTTIRPTVTTRPPTVTTRPPTVTTRPTVPSATTTRPTTPPTTSTLPVPVVFNPASFEFAPTIIDAGRRTASIDLFNPGRDPATVLAVRVEPAGGGGFSADGSGCVSQQLLTGGSCAVGVEFAPTAEGSQSASIVADLSDGTTAVLELTGFGAPPPTLTVTPDVAGNGQVVSVEGAGFPTGITVELSWDGGRVRSTPLIDGVGGFVETLVVLPNTAGGTTELVVAGQVDLFADVTADLLVGGSRGGPDVAVFSRLGPSVAR